MSGPPNGERRPQESNPTTGDVLSNQTSARVPQPFVNRLGPPCGCLHGGTGHECSLAEPQVEPVCDRVCSTWDVQKLLEVGRLYPLGCPCSARGAA